VAKGAVSWTIIPLQPCCKDKTWDFLIDGDEPSGKLIAMFVASVAIFVVLGAVAHPIFCNLEEFTLLGICISFYKSAEKTMEYCQ
jgi:hypothetical protein